MKIRKTKKGFTIVELVIVIAVIGVLTAILVPTFISLTAKANKASDQSLVANLNTALKMQEAEDGAKNPTMHDAVLDLAEQGFDLGKLVTKSKEALLWNSETNQFELEKDQAGAKFWKIYDAAPASSTVSVYAKGNNFGTSVTLQDVGFDAGYVTTISQVNYTGTAGNDVVIRTAGDQTVLTVDAPNDNIDFYGFAKEINVVAVKGESLHIYGSTAKLSVTSGHVQVEDTGIVFELAANTGSVTNNGYIAQQTSGTAPTGNAVGGNYEINSLARLEAFRDSVNAGNDFLGQEIRLTSNITLKDGWKPIGEGNRTVVANNTNGSGTYFRGTFDGGEHTISNLNNKGFTPTAVRYDSDKGYAYGLFALVGDGAVIRNLKLENVKIDTSITDDIGDSVAALVGYAEGSVTISGITVSGSVKAVDGVAGVLGRVYAPKGVSGTKNIYNVNVTNCSSSATVEALDPTGGKAAGIIAMAGDQSSGYNELHLSVTGCSNSGNITTHASKPLDGNVAIVSYITLSTNNGRASTYVHD